MKYLYSWLIEFVPTLPSLETLEPLLIQLGHDVESCERITYAGVVVAEILEIRQHPNADRLKLVRVSIGNEEKEVVCGAPNVAVGLKVPYAAVGTTLPCGLTLKPAKIRGEVSEGMLCAEDELGIGPSHEGLLVLPSSTQAGTPLVDVVAPDYVLALDITPTRGDVLSHFGMARDIAAATLHKTLEPVFPEVVYSDIASAPTLGTVHPDTEALYLAGATCESPAYTPLLVASRLFLLGHKSINVATDITNYVMLEYGQPLHAYDATTLTSPIEIGVRRAHASESFLTLGGHKLTLSPQALVVVNQDTPIALAGVMGGETTKTSTASQQVVFEAARFNQKTITLSSRGLNLISDSSLRFERGIDPKITLKALERALQLWQSITGGHAARPIAHEAQVATPPAIVLTENFVTTRLGIQVTREQIVSFLTSLGCQVATDEDKLMVTPPTWRFDLHYPEDYVEEILRMLGTAAVTPQPLLATVPQWKRSEYWRREFVKDTFVAMGSYEIETYPFVTARENELFGKAELSVRITVPPQENRPYLRQSLIPGVIQSLAANPEIPFLNLFELGTVYDTNGERTVLCIGVASNAQSTVDDWWQNAFEKLKLPVASWMTRVKVIDEAVKDEYKLRKSTVTVLEVNPDDLNIGKNHEILPVVIPDLEAINYGPLSKYQASRRDIAIVVSTAVSPAEVTSAIQGVDSSILDVDLFDTYTSPQLGEAKQSLAFHILYQAPDCTLTSEEVTELHERVTDYLKEHFNATIR